MSAMKGVEDAARRAMVNMEPHDPLPPGPNYGPFGYFRLAVLAFAVFVAVLLFINLF